VGILLGAWIKLSGGSSGAASVSNPKVPARSMAVTKIEFREAYASETDPPEANFITTIPPDDKGELIPAFPGLVRHAVNAGNESLDILKIIA
jgi:hypothetical protein